MRGKDPLSSPKSNLAPCRSDRPALWTFTARTKPCVSTSRCRLRPQIFFPGVEPALDASDRTGFDRLAVDDGRTRFFFSVDGLPRLFAEVVHGLFPGPIQFPETEIVVRRLAVWQIVRHL